VSALWSSRSMTFQEPGRRTHKTVPAWPFQCRTATATTTRLTLSLLWWTLSSVHSTNYYLISPDLVSSDLISSELTQFIVAASSATNQKRLNGWPRHCRHWIHCRILRGLRDLLRCDWSQPRRTESLRSLSVESVRIKGEELRWG